MTVGRLQTAWATMLMTYVSTAGHMCDAYLVRNVCQTLLQLQP